MKVPLLLVFLLFSGYVISQTCTGNCAAIEGGLSVQLNAGGTSNTNFHTRCHRVWNSSGRVAWAPARTDAEWLGFLSHSASMNIFTSARACP